MRLFPLLLLVVSVTSYGAVYSQSSVPVEFTYDDTKWTVTWPTGQPQSVNQEAVDKKMADNTVVALQQKDPDEGYRTRISLVTDSLDKFPGTPQEQLEKYKVHAIQFWKSQRFDVEESSKTPGKYAAGFSEPQHEMIGFQRDFKLKFWQVVFIHQNKAYILSAAARVNKFDERKPQIKAIFDSFKFKTQTN